MGFSDESALGATGGHLFQAEVAAVCEVEALEADRLRTMLFKVDIVHLECWLLVSVRMRIAVALSVG